MDSRPGLALFALGALLRGAGALAAARRRDPRRDASPGRDADPEAAILDTETLTKDFKRNVVIIAMQAKGL